MADIGTLEIILGIILAILAIGLIVLIGLQKSKRHGLGNSIAGQGASESYINKNKLGNKNKALQRATLISSIVFVLLVLSLYVVGTIEPKDTTSGTASGTTSKVVSTETSK